jgi:hypothetical protein
MISVPSMHLDMGMLHHSRSHMALSVMRLHRHNSNSTTSPCNLGLLLRRNRQPQTLIPSADLMLLPPLHLHRKTSLHLMIW